jgi:ribosomal-protein-alanine N-acetyltransferase
MKIETRLYGENLILRPVELSDVHEDYVRWMNDAEVNRYMETRFRPQTQKDIEAYVTSMIQKPNVHFFAILLKESSRHIGNIKLEVTSPIHRRGEISLFVGEKECWGKGFASEAIRMARDFGIRELGLHKLTAGCYSNNPASARAFEKGGFVCEAILKEHYFCEDRWVDRHCLAFMAPERRPTRDALKVK